MQSLQDLINLPTPQQWRFILTGTALFTAGYIARSLVLQSSTSSTGTGKNNTKIIKSPRVTLLPELSPEELKKLPYPLDALPGARDVDTPYGSIRVYEFGPREGRKVLLVHGISTPCISLGGVANGLVAMGCRVMLFDLPGRGYSDVLAGAGVRQDSRFFMNCILCVLVSSELSWVEPGSEGGGFDLVGYSLGGGISAGFTAYFPHLVRSLVLIAPSGLIRDRHISRTSKILYSEGVIPESILNWLVRRRMQRPMYPPKDRSEQEGETGVAGAVQAEVNIEGNQRVVLSKLHPEITVEDAVAHQVTHHEGFVFAFMSSIRYGPVQHQHGDWQRIGRKFGERNEQNKTDEKVLVVLGKDDPIINVDEVQEDAWAALDGNVKFVVMDAGHEAPVTKGDEVAQHIWDFWTSTGGK